jgi:hypothetical protein
MSIYVWANSRTSPITTCEDAKLSSAPTLVYPAGDEHGQAGWDVGLLYQDTGDLMRRLQTVKDSKGPVTHLAINSHGAPGFFDLDGSGAVLMTQNDRFLSVATMGNKYNSYLASIKLQLAADATVLFMGCNLGKGPEGSNFLQTLSETLFRGLLVVAFTTIGVSMRQYRAGECAIRPLITPRARPYKRMHDTQEERCSSFHGLQNFRLTRRPQGMASY